MNNRIVFTLATFAVVAIAFVWFSMLPYSFLVIVIVCALFLFLLIPEEYGRHIATFEIMFIAGYLLGLLAQRLIDDIPAWPVWTWLALSLAVSVFFPIPDLRRGGTQG